MKTRYKILLVITISIILYLIMHSTYLFNVCEFIVNSSDNGCMVFWNVDTSIHITSDVWDSNDGIGDWSYIQYTHYETWGNNEHWYFHPDGYDVECEIRLFQSPSPCKAIDEYGNTVDIKTGLGNWNGVKWLDNSYYCKDQGGVWNDTARGCYGLYEMCENNGGIPRFLKKSLPFPDVEENKPIEFLMDCYYGHLAIEVDYFDESVFTGTLLLNNNNPELVKGIFENCNCQADPERTCEHTFIDWQNETHHIDNMDCKWEIRK